MDLISKSEEGNKLRALADLKDEEEDIKEELSSTGTAVKWISGLPLMSDYEAAISISKQYNINITEAKAQLDSFPKEYIIEDKSIPQIVKDLRKYKRTLKGENKYI